MSLPPDMLRGTPLQRFAGITAEDYCACTHKFANHYSQVLDYQNRYIKPCALCACRDFTTNEGDTSMTTAAETNGYEMGRKLSAVFVIREDASYQDKVALGMQYANREGLNLENGASYVTGFVNGLDSQGRKSARGMSLEDKIDLLLEQKLQLGEGKSNQASSSSHGAGVHPEERSQERPRPHPTRLCSVLQYPSTDVLQYSARLM